jgi:Tol biopolymer transport system component
MKHLYFLLIIAAFFPLAMQAQIRLAGEPVLIYDNASLMLNNPVPSPDGRYILLAGPRFNGLWLMDLESGTTNQLYDNPSAGFGAVWTSDAAWVIARTERFENQRRTFALIEIDIHNSEISYITEYQRGMTTTPMVHAGTSSVLIATSTEVQSFNLSSAKSSMTAVLQRPSAHANGNKLFLTLPGALDLIEFQPFEPDQWYLNASASPDGQKIAFEIYGGNLHVLNISDGFLTDLGPGYHPTWSPDSRYLSFTRNEDDGYRHTYGEIVVAAADGSESLVLYSSDLNIPANPHWHPTQNRIYFDYMVSGTIMAVDIEIQK